MATLSALLQSNSELIEVKKGELVERVNTITATKVIMDSGAVYPKTSSGWELKRPELNIQKETRIIQIDARTQEIISNGFQFDGQMFSLSTNAQQNWTVLMVMLLAGKLTFPFKITSKDDGSYFVQNLTDLSAFIDSAFYAVNYQLEYGRVLKAAVLAATTQTELDAVVDAR